MCLLADDIFRAVRRTAVGNDNFLRNDGLIENTLDSIPDVESAIVYRHAYTHGHGVKHIGHAYNNARWQDLLARSQSNWTRMPVLGDYAGTAPCVSSPRDRSATIEFVLASHTDEKRKDFSATVRHLLR